MYQVKHTKILSEKIIKNVKKNIVVYVIVDIRHYAKYEQM